ncbi:MAG: phosphoribosylglycinamide formyltransferase [Epulopiscium sp. Nele67-Bin002]|nr:MAG: phosphoribosylglycinamide formyltransferase [Epulopiscium sp. Nuni2H_MBin001]OON91773.1 MAG: phosphoribosylglycinamide formyltransferase [Epulopiscium sp. Nele67-Bin001]OON92001.1 MAG: phosphoribosylglycinamide formyltransferase [Epulopiscium sp. Nele67-Bin002]
MLKIGVLVSGSGSNLQAIIDADDIESEVVCVISSNPEAYALTRAQSHGIACYCVTEKGEDGEHKITHYLKQHKVDLVVLAGYLRILGHNLLKEYQGRIINIHPSLLPKFGGKGYYGIAVHKAVIENKEKKSGATVHYVEDGIDTGEIILQRELDVQPDDTAQTLAQRILNDIEHSLLIDAIKLLEKGE